MTAIPDFKEQKIEVASFIREVFSYISRFKGQLFVLKIEDSLMNHPLFPVLIKDISFLHKAKPSRIIVRFRRRNQLQFYY